MSPFFVSHFKTKNPCPHCPVTKPSSRAAGKSLCASHLTVARLAWRLWASDRRDVGKCINCNRKSWKTNCRCKSHREENRKKCQLWSAAHPERQKLQAEKKAAIIDSGFCPCAARNPLLPGFRRCSDCRALRKKNDPVKVAEIVARRTATKETKIRARAEITRQQLAQMGFMYSGKPGARRIQSAAQL